MPRVNPDILRWARETAGLDLEIAAKKVELGDARGVVGSDRLSALEAGDGEPSRALIVRMAKQYRRPLLTFYLAQAPRRADRGQDFRQVQNPSPDQEGLLDALVRDVLARQDLLRAAILEAEAIGELAFVGSTSADDPIDVLVAKLRAALQLSMADLRAAGNVDAAFGLLRHRIESAGVFVLLLGDLGSHHTAIGADSFRGFAIADRIAPFVVINTNDSRAAWSFTLLHELTHVWLGQTGISGGIPRAGIERYCNEVASEFLLPASELREIRDLRHDDIEALAAQITAFARPRNLSRTMVAYRLERVELISQAEWNALRNIFRAHWIATRDQRREDARESEGGPTYYVVRRHRLGQALLSATAQLMAGGSLSTVKASQVLGVRPTNVGPLLSGIVPSARAS
jgi:Zn-dependent peptidase ImmA (M78 family)